MTRTAGGVVLFTDRGVVLPGSGAATGFEFVGGSAGASWSPSDPTGDTTSYYVGRDPAKWAVGVAHYRRLTRRQVYPGIDLVYHGKGNRLEYDLLLAPGADPSRIRMRFTGVRRVSIADDGSLAVETASGPLRHEKPVLFQTLDDGSKAEVEGAFRIVGRNEVGFQVRGHDPNRALCIDPVLESSTYFGGSADDKVVAVSTAGLTVGTTTSVDFPGATLARRKGSDIFVRLPSTAFGTTTTLVVGGSGDEQVTSASFDPSSSLRIVVGGYTDSKDLPTFINLSFGNISVPTPLQRDFAGGASDGFLLVVSTSNQLTAALTYIGTPGDDRVTGVTNSATSFAVVGTTNSRGLPQSQLQDLPSEPAGGTDGFLLVGQYFSGWTLSRTTYFGGSGDDLPLSVLISGAYYVTGETRSPDFPLVNALSSTRRGESDAFVMRFSTASQLAASTLVGGSGSERGVQVRTVGPLVAVAGTTSSHDFPVQSAVQATNGGGTSDAFITLFNTDLSQITSSTYLGGSAADEATSLAADFAGNMFVGGWTSSTDFPVSQALQTSYGGGPDDGFMVHFGPDGSRRQSTYFGGSGSDRVLSVAAPAGPTVWLGGHTTSADLPLKDADQPGLLGASDGFIVRIGENAITPSPVIGGKDLRSTSTFYAGSAAVAASTNFTITSSDPSKVQLAVGSEFGQSAIQVRALGSAGQAFYYVDCLVDQGGADLTIAAPGVESRTVSASCFPAQISVFPSSPTSIRLWAQPRSISFSLFARDPQSSAVAVGSVRPGVRPVIVSIANSNPAVGTLSVATYTLGSGSLPPTITATAVGETELTFFAPGLSITPERLTIQVTAPVTASSAVTVPSGFQGFFNLAYSTPPDRTLAVTLTSQDPTRVLLTTDPTKTGSGTLSLPLITLPQIYAQGLASSGDVPVVVSVPGQEPFSVIVHLSPPTVRLTYSRFAWQPIPLAIGESVSMNMLIGAIDWTGACSCPLNPGANPLRFALNSSNPSVVTVTPAPFEMRGGTSPGIFTVRGATDGDTTLTLQSLDGIPVSGPNQSLAVAVRSKSLRMEDREVGQNLYTSMSVTLPSAVSAALIVHVTSSNPELALLTSDSSRPGQAQIDVSIGVGGSGATFYVQGLAAAGQALITAQVPGVGTVTGSVVLLPSGFGWSLDRLALTLYSTSSSSASIAAFALDPVTLQPIAQQGVRPGISFPVGITNSNPDAVSLNLTTVTLPSTTFLQITPKAAGEAVLSLVQPSGFTTPLIRQRLSVKVGIPTLSLSELGIGRGTQVPVSLFSLPSTTQLLTLTSSDPSKVLVTADPAVLGSASVTISPSAVSRVRIQALSDQGSVTLTASMPTVNPTTATVRLLPTTIRLYVDPGSVPPSNVFRDGKYSTTTQSSKSKLALFVHPVTSGNGLGPNAELRAGLAPMVAEVTSSQASVGTIAGSPVQIGSSSVGLEFVPAGVGDTEVSAVLPPGFVAVPGVSNVTFRVSAPGFFANRRVIGKDTFGPATVILDSTVLSPTTDVAVTLTSSDPARLLLSRDAASAPSASITQTLIARRSDVSFYIHALANSGSAPVQIQAPGYADSVMDVVTTDIAFAFDVSRTDTPLRVLVQSGAQSVRVIPTVVFPTGLPPGYSSTLPTLRPGADDVVVGVASSDPSVVSVDASQLVFRSGTYSVDLTYRPVKEGTADLVLSAPSGFLVLSSKSRLSVSVESAKLSISSSGGSQIGRDLQSSVSISLEGGFPAGKTLQVTSSDPSKLLLSTSPTTPGQATLNVTPLSFQSPQIYLQSLASEGSPTVTATVEGHSPLVLQTPLTPAGAVFNSAFPVNTSTTSPRSLFVTLNALDPVSLLPRATLAARPGANLSVSVTSSDPKVLTVSPSSVQFSDGDIRPVTVTAQPVGPGTAVVSLGTLPGGAAAASGRQIVVNVAAAPSVNNAGTVNGASFTQFVTAGGITSVFGANFAAGNSLASVVPLPSSLAGASVSIGGYVARLFFVGPNQINFQIPWEVAGQTLSPLTVNTSVGNSETRSVIMRTAAPGIFTTNSSGSGQGAVLIANSDALAAPAGSIPGRNSRPAQRGEFVTIFCTGLGAVSNRPQSGAAAPASPLASTTVTPVVMIGGNPATVSFAGLAPGFVSLYQINVHVPFNATPGSAVPVLVSVGGMQSNQVTIAVQ